MIDDPRPTRSRSAIAWIAGIGGLLILAGVVGYAISSRGTVPGIADPPAGATTAADSGLSGTPGSSGDAAPAPGLNAPLAAGVTPGAVAQTAAGRPTPDLAAPPPPRFKGAAATERLDFQPAMPEGEARVGGFCDRESLLAPRADAFHCLVDNQPYDPCYAVAGDAELVICGARPTVESTAFLLRLVEPPPPARGAAPPDEPWVIEVGDTVCERRLGLHLVTFGGKPIRYDCRDGTLIVDLVSTAATWAAQRVTIRLEDEPLADTAVWEPISRAWW